MTQAIDKIIDGKKPMHLTPDEAALIVGVLQAVE